LELRINAAVAVLAGIVIVKLEDVLSEPKSNTAIDGLPITESLYIKAQRAVTDALNTTSAKSTKAVYSEELIVTPVKTTPPATYPVPVTSLVALYTVVASFKSTLAVYRAIFNVLEDKL
jgi:hypothetical protein